MGWKDDPIVNEQVDVAPVPVWEKDPVVNEQGESIPAWEKDPVVEPGTPYSIGQDAKTLVPETGKALARGAYSVPVKGLFTAERAAADAVTALRRKWRNFVYGPGPVREGLQAVGVLPPTPVRTGPGEIRARELEGNEKVAAGAASFVKGVDEVVAETPALARDEETFKGSFRKNPSVTRIVAGGAESLPTMAATMGAGLPAKLAGTVLAWQDVADEYNRQRDQKVPEETALANTLAMGIGTAILERTGLGAVTGKSGATKKLVDKMGASWVAHKAVAFGAEGGTEALQQAWQNAVAKGYDEDRSVFDGALESFLSGGLLGAVMAGKPKNTPKAQALKELQDAATADALGENGWFDSQYARMQEKQQAAAAPETIEPGEARRLEEEAMAAADRGEGAGGDPTEGGLPGPDFAAQRLEAEVLAREAEQTRKLQEEVAAQRAARAPIVDVAGAERMEVRPDAETRPQVSERKGKTIDEQLWNEVKAKGLEGELALMAAELEETRHNVQVQGSGTQPILDDRGQKLGNMVLKHYREGFSGKDAPAIRRFLKGQKLGADQAERVRKAVEAVAQDVFREMPRQDVKGADLEVGDKFKIEGEQFRVKAKTADAVVLKDGVTIRVKPEQTVALDEGTWQMRELPGETAGKQKPGKQDTSFDVEAMEAEAARAEGAQGLRLEGQTPLEMEVAAREEARRRQEEEMLAAAAAPLEGRPVDTTGDLFDASMAEAPLFAGPTPKVADGKPQDFLSRAEAAVDERLAAIKAEGRMYSGIDPELTALWVSKGAIRIARGMRDFATWAADMVREFGAAVKPHLSSLWESAQAQAGEWSKRVTPVPGRPDLSGIAEDEIVREMVNVVDQERNADGLPERLTFAESDRAADARLAANEAGEFAKLKEGQGFGVSTLASDVRTAQKIITREGIRAIVTGDLQAADRVMDAIWQYRTAMSNVGRGLAEGRDRFATPEERNARMITESLFTPDPITEEEIRKAQAARDVAKLRILKQKQAVKAAAAQQALLEEEGIDLRRLTPEDMRNPVLVAKIGRFFQTRNATFGDKVLEYWINSLLSAPPTWIVNTVGTGANVLWTQTVEKIASATINSVARQPGAPTFAEVRAAWRTLSPGMVRAAWGAAKLAWQTETPQLGTGDKLELPKVAIGGKTGRVIRTPGRILRLSDEFMKRMAFEMDMAGLAYREAARVGKEKGLTADQVQELAARYAAEPTVEMRRAAIGEARRQTFTAPANAAVQAINRLKAAKGVRWPATFLLPFANTPVQVLGRGLRMTPLGAVRLAYKGLSGQYKGEGGGAAVKDVAETVAGTALAWLALALAGGRDDEGRRRITGSRVPTTESGEKGMRQLYEPPMSVRFGGQRYSYNRFDPFAAQLATLIDLGDAVGTAKEGQVGQAAKLVIDNAKGMIRDRTFMQGLSDFLKAMETGESGTDKVLGWAGNFAASWVPNIVRSTVRAFDPKVRDYSVRGREKELERYGAATMHKALPMSGTGPLQKVDHWGRPIEKGDAPGSDIVWRMLVPVSVQDEASLLNVDRLIFNWNRKHEGDAEAQWWPNWPALGVEVKGTRVEMDQAEYQQFLALRGRVVLSLMQDARVNFDDPKRIDLEVVKRITTAATTAARRKWLAGKLADAGYSAELVEQIRKTWTE